MVHGLWVYNSITSDSYVTETHVHDILDKALAGKCYYLWYLAGRFDSDGSWSSGYPWSTYWARIPTLMQHIRSYGKPDKFEAHCYLFDNQQLDWESPTVINSVLDKVHDFKKYGWDGIQCDVEKRLNYYYEWVEFLNRWHSLFINQIPRRQNSGVLQIGDGIPRKYNKTTQAIMVGTPATRQLLTSMYADFNVPMMFYLDNAQESTWKTIFEDVLSKSNVPVIIGISAEGANWIQNGLDWAEEALAVSSYPDKFAGMACFADSIMSDSEWTIWNSHNIINDYADRFLTDSYKIGGRHFGML